jgi:hypothetical protein
VRRGLFIAMAFGAACVLPPPVSLENGVNQYPYIDDAEPAGPEVDVNLNCDNFCFEVHADDPDPGDILYFRYFWDYDPNGNTTIANDPSDAIEPPKNGELRAYMPYSLTPSVTFSTLTGANTTETHSLEVVVTDRGWSTVAGQAPVNQALGADGLSVTYRWTVNFIQRGTTCDTPAPAQCGSR